MSIYEEIQGWLAQITSEVRALQVLLDNEQDEIETVQLVVEENVEVKAGSLHVDGIMQAGDSVDVGDLSHLVEKFSSHLKEDGDEISIGFRRQVRGDTGEQGQPGETGDQGQDGKDGPPGLQGNQGDKGDTGDSGRDRAALEHNFTGNPKYCHRGCRTKNPRYQPPRRYKCGTCGQYHFGDPSDTCPNL